MERAPSSKMFPNIFVKISCASSPDQTGRKGAKRYTLLFVPLLLLLSKEIGENIWSKRVSFSDFYDNLVLV